MRNLPLEAYPEAEVAYAMSEADSRSDDARPLLRENYAACIYRRGEALQAADLVRSTAAVFEEWTLAPSAPSPECSMDGHAGGDLEDWGGAIPAAGCLSKLIRRKLPPGSEARNWYTVTRKPDNPPQPLAELLARGTLDPEAARRRAIRQRDSIWKQEIPNRRVPAYGAYVASTPSPAGASGGALMPPDNAGGKAG